jgi:hypothetical protein
LFGIQNEESPKYKVLFKEGSFEIRQYDSYLVAQTTIKGDFNESSSEAFRILAGYIFGKNKGDQKLAMTSPVEIKQDSTKIPMTSPVTMQKEKEGESFTMTFSMPSKYTLEELPVPLDDRIKFKKIDERIVASHQFSWLRSKSKTDKKANELKDWLKKYQQYQQQGDYFYAGYNPPWTIPFLRRNEVHIELIKSSL